MIYLLLAIFIFLGLVAGGTWFCWERYRDEGLPQWLLIGLWVVGAMWFMTWSLVLVVIMKVVTTDFERNPPTTSTSIQAR